MLSYQHTYHAGNFADVQKHAALVRLLAELKRRYKVLCVIDTHAGRGVYNLASKEARKTGESEHGIAHFLPMRGEKTPLADYLKLVEAAGRQQYPGSAAILARLLRAEDRIVLAEKHPQEFTALQAFCGKDTRIDVLKEDGLHVLQQRLPVSAPALVVVDPSYEVKGEYQATAEAVCRALERNPQACFLVWYPILEAQGHCVLRTRLIGCGAPVLAGEIQLKQKIKENFGMLGSGVVVINPPSRYSESFDKINRFIAARLPVSATYTRIHPDVV